MLTLPELDQELERYLIGEYLVTPHRETGQAPQARWDAGGFLPQMPESLEQLDLLLLTAYAGEEVVLRYDPRDMAEIRLFYHERFLCRAICQELASETVTLGESCATRRRAAAWLIRCSRPNALRPPCESPSLPRRRP